MSRIDGLGAGEEARGRGWRGRVVFLESLERNCSLNTKAATGVCKLPVSKLGGGGGSSRSSHNFQVMGWLQPSVWGVRAT